MAPISDTAPLMRQARAARAQLGAYALELRLIARGEVWPRSPIRLNGGAGQTPTPDLLAQARHLSDALHVEALKHGFRSASITPIWHPET